MLGDAVFAYLDPGTGSMLVQLLVGGVAAAGVAIKLYWHRILRLLRIRKAEPEPDREPCPPSPAPSATTRVACSPRPSACSAC